MSDPFNPYGYPTKPAPKTSRYTFRCLFCKHRWTADFELSAQGWKWDQHGEYYKPVYDFSGRRPFCQICPECKSNRTAGLKITGRKNETPCDNRCTGATGDKCECSCGGENHGSAHLLKL